MNVKWNIWSKAITLENNFIALSGTCDNRNEWKIIFVGCFYWCIKWKRTPMEGCKQTRLKNCNFNTENKSLLWPNSYTQSRTRDPYTKQRTSWTPTYKPKYSNEYWICNYKCSSKYLWDASIQDCKIYCPPIETWSWIVKTGYNNEILKGIFKPHPLSNNWQEAKLECKQWKRKISKYNRLWRHDDNNLPVHWENRTGVSQWEVEGHKYVKYENNNLKVKETQIRNGYNYFIIYDKINNIQKKKCTYHHWWWNRSTVEDLSFNECKTYNF